MKSGIGFAMWVARHAVVLLAVVSLTGCLEEDKKDEQQPTEQPTNEPPAPPIHPHRHLKLCRSNDLPISFRNQQDDLRLGYPSPISFRLLSHQRRQEPN